MLPRVPGEKREGFVLEMVEALVKQGSRGMSDEELEDFKKRIIKQVKQTKHAEPEGDKIIDIDKMVKG